MEFDTLIRHGTVVDGSGREPAHRADVGIVGDRIVAVDDLASASAETVLDATGMVVAPGFVDVHIHSEIALTDPTNPYRYGGVLQGVTTHLTAPDGIGWAPLPPDRARELWRSTLFSHGEADLNLDWPTAESYLGIFAGRTPANLVPQVPHCAVRMSVMEWDARAATDDELGQMNRIVREWMEAGATCLSLGLDYQPSAFADTRELIELCKVVREYGGIYAAHARYTDLGREGAWRETIEIGRRADIPVHLSHEQVDDETEPLLAEAESDCDLTFESYLYPAGCTHLAQMLPTWAQAGGPEALYDRLRDPELWQSIRDVLHARLTADWGSTRIVFVATQTGRYIGENLFDVAAAEGLPVGDMAVKVLAEEHPYALMVYHRGTTSEQQRDGLRRTIRHPRMMVASDGVYHGTSSHPRGYGCFARVLRLGVRDMGAVALEEAIHKMSGFPAERFRIRDRGLLRPGFGADIVIFDPSVVADRATWEEPRLEPAGVQRVLVNGQSVVAHGRPTGLLPGRVLRHEADLQA